MQYQFRGDLDEPLLRYEYIFDTLGSIKLTKTPAMKSATLCGLKRILQQPAKVGVPIFIDLTSAKISAVFQPADRQQISPVVKTEVTTRL